MLRFLLLLSLALLPNGGQGELDPDDLAIITSANASEVVSVGVVHETGADADIIDAVFHPHEDLVTFISTYNLTTLDLTSLDPIYTVEVTQPLDIAISPDGDTMAGMIDYDLWVWPVDDFEQRRLLTDPELGSLPGIVTLRFASDGSELVAADFDVVFAWESETWQFLRRIQFERDSQSGGSDVILSASSEIMGRSVSDAIMEIRETLTGNLLTGPRLNDLLQRERTSPLTLLTFTLEEDALIISFEPGLGDPMSNDIVWLNLEGEMTRQLWHPYNSVYEGAISPDGTVLAISSGFDGGIYLLDTDIGDTLAALEGHTLGITSLTFNADGTLLMSTSGDGTLRLWGIPAGE
jgi:WD40 repeat protein